MTDQMPRLNFAGVKTPTPARPSTPHVVAPAPPVVSAASTQRSTVVVDEVTAPRPRRAKPDPSPQVEATVLDAGNYNPLLDDDDAEFSGASTNAITETNGRSDSGERQVVRRYRRLNDLDRLLIDFITRFKMAKVQHLAALAQTTNKTVANRLRRLEADGYLRRIAVPGDVVWMVTSKGAAVAGTGLKLVTEADLRLTTFPHYWVAAHIAANMDAGNKRVLDPSRGPRQFTVDAKRTGGWHLTLRGVVERCSKADACRFASHFDTAEQAHTFITERADRYLLKELRAVSEFQTRTALNRAMRDPETKKTVLDLAGLAAKKQRSFNNWVHVLGMDPELSPELLPGNEHYWSLTYVNENNVVQHHPADLVIPNQPIVKNGKRHAMSIAVEVELHRKSDAEDFYPRILEAYDQDSALFGAVYWVVATEKLRQELTGYINAPVVADSGVVLKDSDGNPRYKLKNRKKFRVVPIYRTDGSAITDEEVRRQNGLWEV